jgi:hypothetical protein
MATMMEEEEKEEESASIISITNTTTTATPGQVISQCCSAHVDGASVRAIVLRSVKGDSNIIYEELEGAALRPLPSHRLLMKVVRDSGSGGYEVARVVEIGK